jgi:hypothetical protein
MLLEGKISWVTSSHLGQLYSTFLGGNFLTFRPQMENILNFE